MATRSADFTDEELRAYLDEALPASRAALVEQTLPRDTELQARCQQVARNRDQGAASLGEIWRRHGLSCPSTTVLQSYRAGSLGDGFARVVQQHVEVVGCPRCTATLSELEVNPAAGRSRVEKIFATSVGRLSELDAPPASPPVAPSAVEPPTATPP
jgi:hypothetical protein